MRHNRRTYIIWGTFTKPVHRTFTSSGCRYALKTQKVYLEKTVQTLFAATNAAVTILEGSRARAIYKHVNKHRFMSKLHQETHLVFLDRCLITRITMSIFTATPNHATPGPYRSSPKGNGKLNWHNYEYLSRRKSGPTSKKQTEPSLLEGVCSRARACLHVHALCCAVCAFGCVARKY